jgi:long-chain acyl-CoA synthetase
MLSHGNILSTIGLYHTVDPRHDTDNHLSFLPLGWIAEPIWASPPRLHRADPQLPGAGDGAPEHSRIAPEMLFYNARLWDSLVGMVQVRMNDASRLNGRSTSASCPSATAWPTPVRGQQPGPGCARPTPWATGWSSARCATSWSLSRIRAAYTAGSSLSPDAMRFFHALGINLKQIYGSTEVSGGATVHRDNDIKFASVGPPAPGVELRIAADGEIQIAGPMVMQGYYKDAENTARDILAEDGRRWFRTGDAGTIDDDGHLIYLDRVKDMLTLAGGERFSPQFIEGRLKFSPYVRDVMAIGGETREFTTALISSSTMRTSASGRRPAHPITGVRRSVATTAGLRPHPPRVEEVNASRRRRPPAPLRADAQGFDADEAEMTRTRKLRRGFHSAERYGDIIEAMYRGDEAIHVRAPFAIRMAARRGSSRRDQGE